MLRIWNCIETQHDWWLVLLAATVCFLTSLTAITLFQRARRVRNRPRIVSLIVAGTVTGFGVWATHFISILAYTPGFPVQYDPMITACSLIAATVITTAGFAVALFAETRQGGVAGGALVGAGIGCMHYMGMASLRIPAVIVWQSGLVLASILIGVLFGAMAMMVAQRRATPLNVTAAASLLGLAIILHHFVGMGAIDLVRQAGMFDDMRLLSPVALSAAIAAFTAAVVITGLIGAMSDRRNRRGMTKRNMQLDAALNNMGQGLCMFDAQGRLELWNDSFVRMYRLPPGGLFVGATVEQAMAARRAAGMQFVNMDRYVELLSGAIGERVPSSQTAELSDGRIINVRYRPMTSGGWLATHADITERKLSEARIVHVARHDLLTDLPNRIALNEHLAQIFIEASAGQNSFAVARLDIDRFKEINDAFGQATGDAVIAELAKRLKNACNGAFLARPGGDEFCIVSLLGAEPRTAEDLCARLSAVLNNVMQIHSRSIQVSCTIGISIFPQDGDDVENLVAHADFALYRAKEADRGTIRFFEAQMDQDIREKRLLQRDLVVAIENKQFELYYQPQATIDGVIVAFEVLIRWHHPERGLVSPGIFIPIAEETGLIGAIDEWVLREACREAASWANDLSIAINLSPVDFRRGDVVAMLMNVLMETGLSPERVEIEITEGVMIEDVGRAVSILRRIKELGVRVAMDDFGTGYSSLSYLQSFPFDKIKIDQTFVAKIDNNPQSAAIIHAIIGLGRSLHLPVIAEGVETEGQLAFLAAEGCAEVQGYLIGRPQPIAHYRNVVVGKDTRVKRAG
ncbi:EAL domain-containing protein [Tardiphaga sp.]|uniref:bifunctional diguanylate cyclase/phosphodiesterase n=1 Tax=Tardiphaga sp. TaxID=1926292 RepID=UPI002619A05F|nr:EAL domain-containing protein [Tardiphaga sp.]MDB5620220.1 diguanylate cyclase/phosphodiesterase [Tardiphaga sp.]